MKWQNLLKKQCPICDSILDRSKDKGIIYTCPSCEFIISQRKYYEILTDTSHVIRRFMTAQDIQRIEEALTI